MTLKIAILIVVLSVSNVLAIPTYSQVAKVSLDMKNRSLEQVMDEIESQSEFYFIFNQKKIDVNRVVDIQEDNKLITDILPELFDGTNVNYAVFDREILLTTDPLENSLLAIALAIASGTELQQTSISGTVTDASTGEAMPGVNIVVKGTTVGTITDANGKYSILSKVDQNAILVFSFVGYVIQEVPVAGKTVINVALAGEVTSLEEVVVIGYGTAKKSDLTGAITQIKTETLKDYTPSNVSDLLRTSVPGLNVGYSTSAKGNSSLLIRGQTTLTAGSSPLIVLDGVIFNGDLSDINPDDIDRLDIMKDASSAAVYGSRATNGVIAITTKRGTGDTPTINFSSSIGIATAANRVQPYNAASFIKWRSDMFKSVYRATVPSTLWSPFDDPRTIDQQYLSEWLNYHSTTEENMVNAWLSGLRLTGLEIENYNAGKTIDWENIIYHNAIRQDYNISLSGKKNDFTYYWSLGYMNNEALTIGDEFSTIRSRINLEGNATKFLKVGLNAQFSYRDESSVPADNGQYKTQTPFGSYYADDGITLRLYTNDDIQTSHPLLALTYREKETQYYTFFPKIYSILNLPFGITYTMNFTTRLAFYHNYIHDSSEHPAWGLFGGSATRDNSIGREWQIDNIINWNHTFADIHKLDVTLLVNAEKDRNNSDGMDNRYFTPNDLLGYHDMSTGTLPVLITSDNVKTSDALMARVNYGFKSKYLLTLSLRRDGSSLFGYSNPRAFFPAVALGWVLTEENFLKSDVLNYLKLRASWGKNGNRDIANYAALSQIATGKTLTADQTGNASTIPTLAITTMENRNLKWEQTEAINLGIDFNLLNGVLSGSMDAYSMATTDVLVNRLLPTITGYSRVYANMGEVRNKGLEITLNSLNMNRSNFEWRTNFIFSLNRNKIVSITGEKQEVYDNNGNVIGMKEADDIDNNWFIGQATDVIWDYKIVGTWKVGEEAEAAEWNQGPGDFRLQDLNGDGLLTNEDKQFQGYSNPRFKWTMTNSFTFYKNFEASFVIFSLWGQKSVYDLAKHDNHTEDRYNSWDIPYWTPENPLDNYARLRSAPASGVSYSAWFDRSYIRLENIAIAYRVPKSILNRTFISDLKVSFSIRNAVVWAPYWKFGDPEDGTRAQRIYSFGLNMTI